MIDDALDLAASGWPVLPLRGKIPMTRHGKDDATTDPEAIRSWWERWPTANIGIALPSPAIVIDVDPRHGGGDSWQGLLAGHDPLPITLTCITGRDDGGRHFYWHHPGGRISGRRLGPGIDLREGGKHYVVAPPSIHPETGGQYRWADVHAPVVWPPKWLAEVLWEPVVEHTAHRPGSSGGSFDGLVQLVAGTGEGNRNGALYWACRRALKDGLLDQAKPALVAAAQSTGLTDHEIQGTIRSAEQRGEWVA